MKIEKEQGWCTTSIDVCGINATEIRQMHEMKNRVRQVLDSHKNKEIKNDYLKDDELEFIHAILYAFTKEYSSSQTSAFDDALKELNDSTSSATHNL